MTLALWNVGLWSTDNIFIHDFFFPYEHALHEKTRKFGRWTAGYADGVDELNLDLCTMTSFWNVGLLARGRIIYLTGTWKNVFACRLAVMIKVLSLEHNITGSVWRFKPIDHSPRFTRPLLNILPDFLLIPVSTLQFLTQVCPHNFLPLQPFRALFSC